MFTLRGGFITYAMYHNRKTIIYTYFGKTMNFRLIVYAQNPPLTTHADVFNEARGLNYGMNPYLWQYFVYAISNSSGELMHCLHSSTL